MNVNLYNTIRKEKYYEDLCMLVSEADVSR